MNLVSKNVQLGQCKGGKICSPIFSFVALNFTQGIKGLKKICGPESEQREVKDFENVNPEVWQNDVSGSIALVVLISCIWPIVREYDTETVPV